MKTIYIIIDGLGDRPIKELHNKTPLAAANKPYWDALAKKSQLGVHWSVKKNFAPESDAATLSLLGYNPFKHYFGRGPLEAFGKNISVKKNEIALRVNFAFCENGLLKNIEAKVTDNIGKKICNLLNSKLVKIKDVKCKIHHTKDYRAVLILHGKNLNPKISNRHPGYKIYKNFVSEAIPNRSDVKIPECKALAPDSKKTAEIVNNYAKLAEEILNKSKFRNVTNTILLRGAGSKIPKLKKRKNWAAILEMPAEKAIAKLSGMKLINFKGLKNLFDQIENALIKYNGVYVHLKNPDKYSHLGDYLKKKEYFEKLDKLFFSKLANSKILLDCVICVTGDHSTPCIIKAHSRDFVPVMIFNPNKIGDLLCFNENNAKKGSLGEFENGLKLWRKIR
ncbi:MAG: alkaline phosphatase family protein [Candidatus Nanoarchaeia archaeon]